MVEMSDITEVELDVETRLRQEIETIRDIYRRRFPSEEVTLLLSEGDNPNWSDPRIRESALTVQPEHLGAGFLGCVKLPAKHPGASRVSVSLSVPRPPTPAERASTEPDWQPPRGFAALFALAPLVYERIRYEVELRRKRRMLGRRDWASLPPSRGRALPGQPLAAAPESDMSPAVLVGMHWLEVGGAENLGFEAIRWAHEAGLRVFVVASTPGLQRLAGRLPRHPNVTFLRLDRYLPHDHWPAYLENLIRDENIRLIHIHHCAPLYAALAHLRLTAPWLQVIDSTHIVENIDGGVPQISGTWSNYIDLHHVISRDLVDFYRDRFHVMHKQRLGRMLKRTPEPPALPQLNMQVGRTELHVAFVGRMHYQKRPVVVVESVRALAKWARRNKISLSATIVGEGAFLPAVNELVARYGLQEVVTLAPATTDVSALLASADVLLLPSNNEGLALVCYEALQQGCVPLSTDVGSQHEIVPDELLLPLEPRAAVRSTVRLVDRLWRDGAFLARQQQELHDKYRRLAADPTAEELLMPLYQAIARGKEF